MKVYELMGFSAPSKPKDQSCKELVLSDRSVGIEFEIENILYDSLDGTPSSIVTGRFFGMDRPSIPSISNLNLWKIVRDNSLREGVEFISRSPVCGNKIISSLEALDQLYKLYIKDGLGPQATERTSTHVHVDVRDLTLKELINLVEVYLLVERVLFLHVNPSRFKNNYCRPLSDSSFKSSFTYVKKQLEKEGVEGGLVKLLFTNAFEKYSAFNILPVVSQGSVEFRHCEGLEKPSDIIPWLNLIFCIFRTSSLYESTQLIDIYNKSGCWELLNIVFDGTNFATVNSNNKHIVPLMISKGITDLTEILNFDNLMELSYIRKNNENKSLLSGFQNAFLKIERRLDKIKELKKSSILTNETSNTETDSQNTYDTIPSQMPGRIFNPQTDTFTIGRVFTTFS